MIDARVCILAKDEQGELALLQMTDMPLIRTVVTFHKMADTKAEQGDGREYQPGKR
jgi:hypothetical protein